MKFTVEKLKTKLTIIENNKLTSYTGYVFIDEYGKTIIIVYGESRKKFFENKLKK